MDSTLTEDELQELDVILARAAAAGIDPHRVVLALGLDAEAVASQIERARAQSGG